MIPTGTPSEKIPKRGRALGGLEVVGDQRVCGRTSTRLAHADTGAEREQRQEPAGAAAQRGHQAPQPHAHGHHPLARAQIRDARDRKAERRVEDSERRAREQTERGVGGLELLLDRLERRAPS